MKIDDLKFEGMGCCGGHVRAVAEISADERLIITEEEDQTYTVAHMAGGLLKGDLLRGQTVRQVNALLAAT